MTNRVVYYPPSQDAIQECARQICERLAEQYGPSYATPEVIFGLAAFLHVTAAMYATYLNTVCEKEDKVAQKSE